MTYRGLPLPVRIAVALALGVAVGAVIALTLPSAVAGIAGLALTTPEKIPWVTSRVTAFVAYLAIAGSVVYGLLLSTKILDAIAHRPVSFALHQDLAAVGLGLAGIHGALLALDRTIHFTLADLLVPFASPYRPIAVGLGQLALYVVVLVTLSFYARRRIGTRAWRLLHYLTFLAFAGATAHGILAGTDTTKPWAFAIYAASTVAVVFLTTYRIVLGVAASRERRTATTTRAVPGTAAPAGSAARIAARRPA
jgi:sulfoxide reductase heme-binding subunit YedZ